MEFKDIKGIGEKTIKALMEINVYNIMDLIYTFPKTYNVFEVNNNTDIFCGELVTIKTNLVSSPVFIKYQLRVNAIIFYISYNNNRIKCILFSNDYLKFKLFKGTNVILNGKYNQYNQEFLVKRLFLDDFNSFVETDYKIPKIPNSLIKKSIQNALNSNIKVCDELPIEIINKYQLLPISEYIYLSHFPSDKNDVRQVLRRRKYEEFFWYAIKIELLKRKRLSNTRESISIDRKYLDDFYSLLSFELTRDQKLAIEEIFNDLNKPIPMNRLIQGDVGCGKTMCSLACSYLVSKGNRQVAIMVPTELLARQEYEELLKYFGNEDINIALLTSSVKQIEKNDILYRLLHNRINIIVGTHSLLEDKVVFGNLGCVIIDEEHKFGVLQRAKLINKFPNVDRLYLTATPIPRTLGLSNFGDLDISSIKSMPNGRKNVITRIVDENDFNKLAKTIDKIIGRHEQVYVVAPLVNDNEAVKAISLHKCFKKYSEALPNIRIATLSGKMSAIEKNQIMSDFINGRIDLLISTTVIEVGVNVLNASLIVIMNAERFGLSQLHQLRGRVARGSLQGRCALVTNNVDNDRLKALVNTSDGFLISEIDFKLRGPGDYFGVLQSGFVDFEYASFEYDLNIWNCAKEDANEYLPKLLEFNINNDKFKEILKKIENE